VCSQHGVSRGENTVVHSDSISVKTRGNTDIRDITAEVEAIVQRSGCREGTATVFVPGATGALTTVEFEDGLVEDLRRAFERIAPEGIEYRHNLRWNDGNGHSHVRASLVGPSLTAPVADGHLVLGTWQQIVFIDFDVRARSRRLHVTIMGE
jgi:secondary thiamine-phosphate synthase enzyme